MTEEWTEVIPGLWRHDYGTDTGIGANAFAVRLADGGVAVVSPPVRASGALFAATEALGPVRALVAPNTGHDLGQLAWQARYPDAGCYAPAVAIPKLAKAKPGLRPFRALAELAALLPPTTRVLDVPETKSGMTMFVVESGDRRATFLDELISHEGRMPLPARIAFRVTGSYGGVARNRLWTWIFSKDKRAVGRFVLAELEAHPPTVVVVSHGGPIQDVAAVKARIAPIA